MKRTLEGQDAVVGWEYKNVDLSLELVWKSRNTVNKLFFSTTRQQDGKGRSSVSWVKMEFAMITDPPV